jgi:pimeloyl-ACP methyl ester carboxylesterase
VPLHPDTFGDDYIPSGGGTGLQGILRNSPLPPGSPRNTGLVGDDVPLQFAATEAGNPHRMAGHTEHCVNGMTELLDEIRPAVVLTHAWSGTLGFAIADRRPTLVKALVTVEGNNNPFKAEAVRGLMAVPVAYDPPVTDPAMIALADWTPPAGSPGPVRPYRIQAEPARQLTNMRRVPMLWVQGENAHAGPAQVPLLQQAGCDAEFMRLRDRCIDEGNTNLMPLESNNFEVFSLLRDWIGARVHG